MKIWTRHIVCLLLLIPFTMWAQSNIANIKQQINEIKCNTAEYLYAESTAANENDARDGAVDLLYSTINAWAKKTNVGTLGDTKKYWHSLSMPRGNMVRYFVYVKKNELFGGQGRSVQVQVPETVQRIAGITKYAQLASTIEQMKASGEITYYARYAQLDDPTKYYLAIYNTEGNVVAVLTRGTERTNVCTGRTDDVKYYKGCGAIGFTIKQ